MYYAPVPPPPTYWLDSIDNSVSCSLPAPLYTTLAEAGVWYFMLAELVSYPACVCLPARNGLVNKVEFLIPQSNGDEQNFIVVREVLHTNYQPHNLIGPYHSGNKPRNSTLFTGPFLAGRRAWAGHETKLSRAWERN